MNSTSAVYAVLDTAIGTHKVRVSDHTDWETAQTIFSALEIDPRPTDERRDRYGRFTTKLRRIVNPGYTCYGREVRYFAVRDTNDPNWPASRPVLALKSTI